MSTAGSNSIDALSEKENQVLFGFVGFFGWVFLNTQILNLQTYKADYFLRNRGILQAPFSDKSRC